METFLGMLDIVLDITTMLFALLILVGLASIIVLYVLDVTQSKQTIRKNYPVIGRLRYVFEHLGVFFGNTFCDGSRRVAFQQSTAVLGGASGEECRWHTRIRIDQTAESARRYLLFKRWLPAHCRRNRGTHPRTSDFWRWPCTTSLCRTLFLQHFRHVLRCTIRPAVSALSAGAHQSGIWLNTGEGGLSPFHQTAPCDLVFQIGTAKYGVGIKTVTSIRSK